MKKQSIVSSSSGRNQAKESMGRSLAQALSRTAVQVSLPQVRPAGACSLFFPELFYTNSSTEGNMGEPKRRSGSDAAGRHTING